MSKFSKIPVKLPEGVKVEYTDGGIRVSGPKGNLEKKVPSIVKIDIKDGVLMVDATEVSKFGESIKGTIRSHIVNMIKGVTEGWKKQMELVGTGYRAEARGSELILTVGFSHTVTIKAPQGVTFNVEKNVVNIEGSNKEEVSQIAAQIKAVRPPDPYKGKGIRYLGEYLKLKPGKQAAKTAA